MQHPCTPRLSLLRLQGSAINLVGMGATLLGLQATVGLLVAKTLTNATANPFLSGGQGSYNPVLALDVFLVQVPCGALPPHVLPARLEQSCPNAQVEGSLRWWLRARQHLGGDTAAVCRRPPTPCWRTLRPCCSHCGSYASSARRDPSRRDPGRPQLRAGGCRRLVYAVW